MDWPRFVVGVALGIVAFGVYEFMLIAVLRLLGAGAAEFHRARRALSGRRAGVYSGYAVAALAAGLAAGLIPSWWPDAALALAILLVDVGLPLALLPRVRRRGIARRAAAQNR